MDATVYDAKKDELWIERNFGFKNGRIHTRVERVK